MDVRFTDDELNQALVLVVNHIADEAGLSDEDRARLKRWRSTAMKFGSDDMQEFVQKANEDFARSTQRRERSQIRKPDWRQ